VSATIAPAGSSTPRPSNTATQGLPSRCEGEANRGNPVVVEITGDRLRDDAPARCDLVQVEVLHVVLEQEPRVALLDAPALREVGQVIDRPVQPQEQRCEYVFATPSRGDRLHCQLLCGLIAHLSLEVSDRGELRAEVREGLAQARLGQLGDVDGAEAMAQVVEAVAVFADLRRNEPQRVPGMPHPPVGAVRWILAHS